MSLRVRRLSECTAGKLPGSALTRYDLLGSGVRGRRQYIYYLQRLINALMPSGDRGRITSEVSTYVVIGGILPMKGSNNAPLLINFIPSTGPSGIMRLIQKLPVTPADHTQADANQLIRLQEPLSEYGSTPNKLWVTFRLPDFYHPTGNSHANADMSEPIRSEHLWKIAWQLFASFLHEWRMIRRATACLLRDWLE